jgi:hypothetical protein
MNLGFGLFINHEVVTDDFYPHIFLIRKFTYFGKGGYQSRRLFELLIELLRVGF